MATKLDISPNSLRKRIQEFESDIRKNKILNIMNHSAIRNYKKLLAQVLKK